LYGTRNGRSGMPGAGKPGCWGELPFLREAAQACFSAMPFSANSAGRTGKEDVGAFPVQISARSLLRSRRTCCARSGHGGRRHQHGVATKGRRSRVRRRTRHGDWLAAKRPGPSPPTDAPPGRFKAIIGGAGKPHRHVGHNRYGGAATKTTSRLGLRTAPASVRYASPRAAGAARSRSISSSFMSGATRGGLGGWITIFTKTRGHGHMVVARAPLSNEPCGPPIAADPPAARARPAAAGASCATMTSTAGRTTLVPTMGNKSGIPGGSQTRPLPLGRSVRGSAGLAFLTAPKCRGRCLHPKR